MRSGSNAVVTWCNPVWPGYLADPFILRTAAGYYAYKTGMFKRAGLNVTFTPMGPAAIPSAVAGGAVQIAGNNLFSVIAARARNIPFVLIAPSAIHRTKVSVNSAILVTTNSPLKTALESDTLTYTIDQALHADGAQPTVSKA